MPLSYSQNGADRLADAWGVYLVVRGEPEGQVAYAPFGAVDQDDLPGTERLGYAEQLLLRAVRREADSLDLPLLFLAGGAVRPVGRGGVGRQDHSVLRALFQPSAVEGARPALHRDRRSDDGAGVGEDALARLVVVGDRPDVLREEELPRIGVLQVGLHVPELLGIEPLGGRHHRAIHVDKDVLIETVLPSVVLEAEDNLLRLPEGVRRDQDAPLALQGGLVYDIDHLLYGVGERLRFLVGQSCLHDEEVDVPHLRQPGRRDREVVLHADVASVEDGRRTRVDEHARGPKDVAALCERDLRVPYRYGPAERDGEEPLLDLVDRRPASQPSAHRRMVVERADDELGRGRGAIDRHLRPVAHQQRQRPTVVQVRVRYNRRVEPIQLPKVRRQGSPAVGLDAGVDQHPRRAEVEQVAAAAHFPGPAQGAERERRPRPSVDLDPGCSGALRRIWGAS